MFRFLVSLTIGHYDRLRHYAKNNGFTIVGAVRFIIVKFLNESGY